MKKFPVIIFVVTAVILLGGVFLLGKNQASPSFTPLPLPSNLEYFWGEDCPHCKNVADFLNSWDKKDQVKIDKFEVWSSAKNADLMEARYRSCKTTNPAEMGVPLLFTPEGKCVSGDQPIIDYLKELQ